VSEIVAAVYTNTFTHRMFILAAQKRLVKIHDILLLLPMLYVIIFF